MWQDTDYGMMNNFYNSGFNDISDIDSGFTIMAFKLICLFFITWGIISCFFGYKFQKIVTAIWAGTMFGLVGAMISLLVSDTSAMAVGIGIIGFVIGIIVGFKMYKGIFVFCSGMTAFTVGFSIVNIVSLMDGSEVSQSGLFMGLIVGVFIGVGIGYLVWKFFRPLVIILTSLSGGFYLGNALYLMFAYKGIYDYLASLTSNLLGGGQSNFIGMFLGILFVAAGIFFQLKTAERKLSDIFSKNVVKVLFPNIGNQNETGNVSAIGNEQTGDMAGSLKARVFGIIHTKLSLKEMSHGTNYFFLAAAIIGTLDILRNIVAISSFYSIFNLVLNGALIALFIYLFNATTIKRIASKYIVSAFCIAFLVGVCMFLTALCTGDTFGMVYLIGVGLFLIALWLTLAKQNDKPILFVIAIGIFGLEFLMLFLTQAFMVDLGVISLICASLPFALPMLKQYKAAMPTAPQKEQTERKEVNPIQALVQAEPIIVESPEPVVEPVIEPAMEIAVECAENVTVVEAIENDSEAVAVVETTLPPSVKKEKRKIPKILLILPVVCIVFIGIAFFAASQFTAEKTVDHFMKGLQANNYKEAMSLMDLPSSKLFTADTLENALEQYYGAQDVINYEIFETEKTTLYRNYIVDFTMGGGSSSQIDLKVIKGNEKKYIFFPTWKIASENFIVHDWEFGVQTGAEVFFNEKKVDNKYLLKTNYGVDHYFLDGVFRGNYEISVKLDGYQTTNKAIDAGEYFYIELEKEKGSDINKESGTLSEITSQNYILGSYISDKRRLTTEDINSLSKEQIDLLRNEVYAFHGYVFSQPIYHDYFSSKDWYEPDESFQQEQLNDMEIKNIEFLSTYERNQ